MKQGNVYWVTGLSGAGKTTIGSLLYQRLLEMEMTIVFLDGDMLRQVFGNDIGYSAAERKKAAYRNARLCKMLAGQGVDVICCTISMFDDVRKFNRENIENYIEIYLEVPLNILQERDQKGIYSALAKGMIEDVAGMDLHVELPRTPDILIKNHGSVMPEIIVSDLIKRMGLHR